MACLARHVITKVEAAAKRPRVLGLTATIELGAVRSWSSCAMTRLKLEKLLDANVFAPDVEPRDNIIERVAYDTLKDRMLWASTSRANS